MWRPTPLITRLFQVGCEMIACVACLVRLVNSGAYYGSSGALSASNFWATVVAGTIAALFIIFRRPLEHLPLALTLEGMAVASLGSVIICATVAGTVVGQYWYAEYVLAIVFSAFALVAHAITTTQIAMSYLRQLRQTRSTDPLKPYLMYDPPPLAEHPQSGMPVVAESSIRKKEIDVWCYPVQNEQGQLFMDYEPVASTTSSKAPSVHSSRARSVKSFVAVGDQPSDTGRPQSSVETTAGWSVPSANETLQRSERASTALPSYRPPRNASTAQV